MPTDPEWTELINECTWFWTIRNGVYGRLVNGPNGNGIFLPAAGFRDGTKFDDDGSDGYYWSSSLDPLFQQDSWYVEFSEYNFFRGNYGHRYYGYSVRPVTE